MNPVIKFMILSDVVWQSASGLLGPIFALYVAGFVIDGGATVAGVAAAIYLVTKSFLQIPVAYLIDRIRGERDDFWILFIGSLAAALMPLSYLFVHTAGQLYIVQFVFGALVALTFPSYMAIYTRHIDKRKEGTAWGVYFTLVDISGAATAAIGGVIADTIGFKELIMAVVGVSVVGVLLLYPIKSHIRMPRSHKN